MTPLGAALQAVVRHDLDALVAALSASSQPHRGVHEARKAIRRLRAALQLGQRRFGRRGAAIDASLKQLSDGLSDLRDAQVVVELAGRHLRGATDEDQRRRLTALRRRLLAARRSALTEARASDPGFAERLAEVARIRHVVDGLPWAPLIAHDLERALVRSLRRVDRAGERAAQAGASVEQRHRWRRRLRRLRMQWNALKAVRKRGLVDPDAGELHALLAWLRRKAGPFRDLSKTVDALGAEQDRHLLQAVFARAPADPATLPSPARLAST